MNFNPSRCSACFVIVLMELLSSTFSLIIACLVKTRERFMGIGQLLTMPLFFASNAIYPISIMPVWLQVVAKVNPLTYEVDALRTMMLAGWPSAVGLGLDFLVVVAATVVLIVIGELLYPRVVIFRVLPRPRLRLIGEASRSTKFRNAPPAGRRGEWFE